MIKLLAVAFIVVSGSLFGLSLCKTEKESLIQTEDFYELISYILFKIERKSLPLDRIFSDYFSEKRSLYIENFLKETRGSYGEKISHICENVCSDQAKDEMNDFIITLGTLDKASQIESLKKAKSCMEKELSRKRTDYNSKTRLYKTLSLLISCIVAVLLY